jgi:hypothetical protein
MERRKEEPEEAKQEKKTKKITKKYLPYLLRCTSTFGTNDAEKKE